jgi:Hypoxia induced protein conserved region
MDGFVLALLLAAMAATIVSLFMGLFSMARGGEFDKRNANRFMRLRVICQAVAILLFVVFMMTWHRG